VSAVAHHMSATIRRVAKLPYIAAFALVFILAVTWLSLRNTDSLDGFRTPSWYIDPLSPKLKRKLLTFCSRNRSQSPFKKSELGNLFRSIHRPSIRPDSLNYKTYGGLEFQREGDALWKKRLGERLCIIDLDDRKMDGDGQIFSDTAWNFDRTSGLSAGVLNHYMYGKWPAFQLHHYLWTSY
jgi:hypothetical protein